jgi:hypothetical protein
MKIVYKIGNVCNPEEIGTSSLLIPHCVNDVPCMGSGVAYALLKKWPQVRNDYMKWFSGEATESIQSGFPELGHIQLVPVEKDIKVVNMVGQRDVVDFHDLPPVRYQSIKECLWRMRDWMDKQSEKWTVCAPKFASQLAGGSWDLVEDLIYEVFEDTDYQWFVYTLEPTVQVVPAVDKLTQQYYQGL